MGAFKLGNMTFGSLFKKPETTLYPIEKKLQPAGLKGHIVIDVSTCILCGMCDRSCPTDCIAVDKTEGSWTIDRFACIQCGYCVSVCPKKCLMMHPDYSPASTVHASEKFMVPKQEKPAKKDEPKPQAKIESSAEPAKVDGTAAVGKAGVVKPDAVDTVLEGKLAVLDTEKAEKIRAALAASK